MTGMDPEQAARDLAEADQRRHRGAQLAQPPRWWQPAFCLFFIVNSATWDVPVRWRGVLMLLLGSAMLASVILALATARARPLPIRLGWRGWLLIAVIAISAHAIMIGVGLALRTATAPMPFTLSGILVIAALGLLWWIGRRHWTGGYVQQVNRDQW